MTTSTTKPPLKEWAREQARIIRAFAQAQGRTTLDAFYFAQRFIIYEGRRLYPECPDPLLDVEVALLGEPDAEPTAAQHVADLKKLAELVLAEAARVEAAAPPTLAEMIREQVHDPTGHLEEFAADLKKLDERGVVLETPTLMTYSAALSIMQAGGRVTRQSWGDQNRSLSIKHPGPGSDATLPYILEQTVDGETVPWNHPHPDVLGDDWVEVHP